MIGVILFFSKWFSFYELDALLWTKLWLWFPVVFKGLFCIFYCYNYVYNYVLLLLFPDNNSTKHFKSIILFKNLLSAANFASFSLLIIEELFY